MNKFKSIITILLLLAITPITRAESIDNIIEKSGLDKNATIAISVKNANNNKAVYEYNQHKLLNPASIQKTFTIRSAYETLGKEFVFQTNAYIDTHNNLYIKLSGDPSFTTAKLKALLTDCKNNIKEPINDIVIDDTVFDNQEWGIGWMWDDNTSELLPKYSAFSINENKINITIKPNKNNLTPIITNKSDYDLTILNKTQNGTHNNITIDRMPWNITENITISGTVNSPIQIFLPINSPKKNFLIELKNAIKKTQLNVKGDIKIAPVSKDAQRIATVSSQPLNVLVANTLKNSNNFYSEMIFKKAAEQKYKTAGTTTNAVKMFNQYYSGIKSDKIIVVDACGISRNNLISADWVTSALNKIYKEKDFNEFNTLLAKPMEGTLTDRLLNISLKLRAKTGTASNISSIAGYIETKNKDKYSFAIIIQNHNENAKSIKEFEDKIINEIYKLN